MTAILILMGAAFVALQVCGGWALAKLWEEWL